MRVIRSIKMKRQQLRLWRILRPLLAFRPGEMDCGHWWFEFGNPRSRASESYGWWPTRWPGGWRLIWEILWGVPGQLNGTTLYPAGLNNRDPHHGDDADEVYYAAVGPGDGRTDAEIQECLRRFARAYQGKWQWFFGLGQDCQSFQKAAMKHCRLLRGPRA
jgi:hypothetical protein